MANGDSNMKAKLINEIQCNTCNAILRSEHVHDFKCYDCEGDNMVCVDGGEEYLRRVGSNYTELSRKVVALDKENK